MRGRLRPAPFVIRLLGRALTAQGPVARVFWYAASALLLLGVWQAVGHSFGVLFVPVSTTFERLWSMTVSGPIPSALATSGELYGAGLGLSIGLGLILGLLIARARLFAAAFESYVYLLYATPTITLVPFVFAAFGFGFWPEVLIVVLIAMFPVLIGVAEGVRSLPRDLLDVAQSYDSTEAQLWRHVILPYVVPHAMTGIRQAITLSLVGTLVSEFFLNATGVAAILIEASAALRPADVLAVTVLISIFAVILVAIGEALERYLIRWQ